MKIYIVSKDPALAILVSNIVNQAGHTGIISELRSDDPKEQLNDVKMNMDGADAAIVLCSNPKLFAVASNKLPRMKAVACKDAEDAVEAANEVGADIIAIDDNRSGRSQIASIINGWLGTSAPAPKQRSAPQREEHEDYQPQRSSVGESVGGVVGGFKSILGLGEGEPSPAPQPRKQQQKQGQPMQLPKLSMPKVKVKMPKLNLKEIKESLGIADDDDGK